MVTDKVLILDTQVIFERMNVRILVDTIQSGGRTRPYFYLEGTPGAVATVGITLDDQLVLTRQYRHPIRQVIFDLPAGRLNPGETPLDGARREFEEETGYYPEHIEKLGEYNQFPGTLRVVTTLFFANCLRPTCQNLDEGEELDVVLMPVNEVLTLIAGNQFIDGSLQLGVLLAHQKGLI